MNKLRDLKNAMTTQIIGQDEAIDEIVVNLQKSRLGLRDPKKPIFCGFLAGKTGVGKSLTAKLIAKEFFGSEDAHINISMSQFTNASDASKLLGAAAGYVGYEDSSIFDQVRNKPYSLVTFEEAEKADPAIFQQLLKVLDEGIIEMSDGSEISFRNCIILFTSNLGTKELMAGKIGFDDKNKENTVKRDNNIVIGAIKKFFRPEFINRLDSIIVYNSLSKEELTKIVDLEIKDPIDRVAKAGYKVKLPKGIQEFIVSKGREEYGAREIKRNISTLIIDPICKLILEPENMGKKKINVKINKEKTELSFEVV
jgi:ATP-dependent Clp protease ATP-binding subunit ClpC